MSNILTFSIPSTSSSEDPHKILLHQSSNDDINQGQNETNTGFIMWPSAVLLSHYISKNPSIILGDDDGSPQGDVLELGAGCGLVGLTAAALLHRDNNEDKVIFTDYNPAVLDNLQKNVELNEFDVDHKVLGLDWFDQEEHQELLRQRPQEDNGLADEEAAAATWVDVRGNEHAQVRLILGADLLVCTNDADLVASTIDCALIRGGKAFLMGAGQDTRFGVRNFPEACRQLGLMVTVHEDYLMHSNDCAKDQGGGERHLMDALELSGYNQRASTMGDFTFFKITKPMVGNAAA